MINHIAFIMDGNRRWAESKGILRVFGHKEGLNKFKDVATYCFNRGVKYMSMYIFSEENLGRSEEEKNYLFNMFIDESENILKELKAKEVRARFIGQRSLFPESVLPICKKIEEETALFDQRFVNFMFCYGGRQEIVAGVKNIVKRVQAGELTESQIDQQLVYKSLWSGYCPEPDAIVRTGSQIRLSNFMLYQAAYSELFFLDCMWPEINPQMLDKIFSEFERRKRNFGK